MLPCRWLPVLVFVSCVGGEEVPTGGLSQKDAEVILKAQSGLRKHLIRSLADVRERISHLEEFHSVVNGIIQGLQSRNLNPFKSFKNGVIHEQSTTSGLAETIYNLQGPTTLAEWKSLLQMIPNFSPTAMNVHLTAEHLEKIQRTDPVAVVLTGIHKNDIKLNQQLLKDILYNYRFREDSPDAEMLSDNLNQMLNGSSLNFSDFHSNSERPNAILSDILKYIAGKSDAAVAHQITQLLPVLSDTGNIVPASFDVMQDDDYPPDVIQAKDALSSAVRDNKTGLDLSEMVVRLQGRPSLEKLLMIVAKLTSLPVRSPFWKMVHALYPHVKLKYLASRGKFFRPRTASDVGFLLDSFLTAPEEVNLRLLREIRKVFSDFNWEDGLKHFDYSRYAKPRHLILDMFEELMGSSNKLPVCGFILLSYFLRKNNRQVSARWNDILIEELVSNPSTADVQRCPDGPPIKVIDPDSIIEAMGSSHYSEFVARLMRFRPLPKGYVASRRVDVFRAVLSSLRNSQYDGAVIGKLLEMPLNEKGNLPPKYISVCPSEVVEMEAQPSTSESLVAVVPTTAGHSSPSAIVSSTVKNSSIVSLIKTSILPSSTTSDFVTPTATTVICNPECQSPVVRNLLSQTSTTEETSVSDSSSTVEQTSQDITPNEHQTSLSTEASFSHSEQSTTIEAKDLKNSTTTA